MDIVITAGGVSSLIMQGIKWFIRKFIVKNDTYDFPTWLYTLVLPVLNILVVPLLALLGFTGFEMPTDWLGWGRGILQVLIATAISMATYNVAIKPFNTYVKAYRAKYQ